VTAQPGAANPPDPANRPGPADQPDPAVPARQAAGVAWWLGVGSFALAALIVNLTLSSSVFGIVLPLAFLAAVAQSAALLLVLLNPTTATAVQCLGVALLAVCIAPDSGSTWPLTVPSMIILIAYVGLVAFRTTWPVAVVTWWVTVLLIFVAVLLDPRGRSIAEALPILIVYPSISAFVLVCALALRYWRTIRRQLAEARRDVAVEQSQRAVAEERTRIARELHDVVAHSMSVIHMQATSASYRLKDLDPEVKAEFARIAADARSTMREMRRLLAVLRDESADAELAPVPDLSRLGELVESASRAGVPVELRESEAVRSAVLPESVALTAYRIVQESLSNVIRHAPGARTEIVLDLEGVDLVVSVVNDVAVEPVQPMEATERAGHGLHGMRERVRLAGGKLVTGPRTEGGYRVAARLPVGGAE
jgi:signal transduction histidine kinase